MKRRVARVVAAALLVGAPCCSLVVNDDVRRVRCSDDGRIGPPSCELGEICAEGRCRACALREICGDRIDNDCHSGVDDGCDVSPPGAGGESGESGAPDFEATPAHR